MALAIPMTLENAKKIFEKAGREFYNKDTYRSFAQDPKRNWFAVFVDELTDADPMIINDATLKRKWKQEKLADGNMKVVRK